MHAIQTPFLVHLCKLQSNRKWNFRRLSDYELAGNEIFLRHESSGGLGSSSASRDMIKVCIRDVSQV